MCLFISFADCIKSNDAGARECDPEGTDSNSSRGSAIVAAHVDQATHPGDTIDRTIALVDDTRDALSSTHNCESRLLIIRRFLRKVSVYAWKTKNSCNLYRYVHVAVNARKYNPYVFIRDNSSMFISNSESTLNCQISLYANNKRPILADSSFGGD